MTVLLSLWLLTPIVNICGHVGITNPPGTVFRQELPWPSHGTIPMQLYWFSPNYTGGLSFLSYKLSFNRGLHYAHNETTLLAHLVSFDRYFVQLSVYRSDFGNVSDTTRTLVEVDGICEYDDKFFACNFAASSSH